MVKTSRRRRGPWPLASYFLIYLVFVAVAPAGAVDTVVSSRHGERPALLVQSLHKTGPAKLATANQVLFDVEHYTLFLTPDFDQESISGTVRVDFLSLVDGLNRIELDLFQSLQATAVRSGQGSSLGYTHSNDLVEIQLDTILAKGEAASVLVSYEGAPEPAGFLGMQFLEHQGTPILATLSEPYYSRSWWPCKDIPDDKSTTTLYVVVPDQFYCASNGVLTQVIPQGNNKTLYIWDSTYPISAYNVSLAITNYVGWTETWQSPSGKSMEVDFRVFPEDLAKAQVDFSKTIEMLDLYSELFGEYPFVDEKYGMAEFIFDGAMEHQTMSSYGQSLITGDGYFDTLVGHELAHQWFGNLVTVEDWDEVWLHEGFATYAEALWVEHEQGPAARQVFMRQNSAFQVGFWGPVSPPNPLFGDTVYQKGAWVLHMLRKVVGENAFFQILKDYAASSELRYGSAKIEDFVAIAENVSGVELSWFFDQWLYRVGRPDYEISWRSEVIGESYRVILSIRQVQGTGIYRMPLEIIVDTAGGSQSFTIWNDGAYQVSSLVVEEAPLDVRFDPGDWILRWNQYPDVATGTPTLRLEPLQLLPNVPNPFNPSTRLRFRTPGAVPVQLRILDARGRVVRDQDLGVLSAGEHDWTWWGRDDNGSTVASGVYTVILQGAGTQQARRITLVK